MITQRLDRDTRRFLDPGFLLDPADEDTLEMELTPDQMRVLREAAGDWAADDVMPVAAKETVRAPVAAMATPLAADIVVPVAAAPAPNALPTAAPIVAAPASARMPRVAAVAPAIMVSTFAEPVASVAELVPVTVAAPKSRALRGINLTTLLVMMAIASVALASVGYLSRSSTDPKAVPASAPAVPPAPRDAAPIAPASTSEPAPLPADEPSAPVRFKNPFDATEVFEFPAGTSPSEARAAVAATLMERARQRRGMTVNVTQDPQRRAHFEQMTSTQSPRRR